MEFPTTNLTPEQIERYSRQLILKGWSATLQLSLVGLHVAVSAELPSAALYLAAAGVGRISLTGDAKLVELVSRMISRLNPDCDVSAFDSMVESPEAQICRAQVGSQQSKCEEESEQVVDLSEERSALIVVSQIAGRSILRLTSKSPSPLTLIIPIPNSNHLPEGLLAGSAAATCLLQWWRTQS